MAFIETFQVILVYIVFVVGFSIVLEFICDSRGSKSIEPYVDLANDKLESILEQAKKEIKEQFLKDLQGTDFDKQYAETKLVNKVNSYISPGDRIGSYIVTQNTPKDPQTVKNLYTYNPYENYFYINK